MESSYLITAVVLLGCMAATVPVFMCLFFTAVVGFLLFTDLPLLVLAQTLFRSMDNFALVVVLYFILCGNIMTAGSIVHKLIKFANVLVSWLPGGLGMAGIMACGLFGAISGSTVATVVALGGLCRRGHDLLRQPGDHHPPEHQHDPLFHDQQLLPGGALSDRFFPRDPDDRRYVLLFLSGQPEADRNSHHAHPLL
jgi:hypothetical protein